MSEPYPDPVTADRSVLTRTPDLQLTMRAFDGSFEDIRAVAERLFKARQAHPWPPVVTARDGWAQRYDHEVDEDLGVINHVDEAVDWANELIGRLQEAG